MITVMNWAASRNKSRPATRVSRAPPTRARSIASGRAGSRVWVVIGLSFPGTASFAVRLKTEPRDHASPNTRAIRPDGDGLLTRGGAQPRTHRRRCSGDGAADGPPGSGGGSGLRQAEREQRSLEGWRDRPVVGRLQGVAVDECETEIGAALVRSDRETVAPVGLAVGPERDADGRDLVTTL